MRLRHSYQSKTSHIVVATIALLVMFRVTHALASAQAQQRSANELTLKAQANEALGVRDSTIVRLVIPDEPAQPLEIVGIQIVGKSYTLDLVPHSVRTANFVCYEALAGGTRVEVDPGPERTLRGEVREDQGSVVVASLLEDGLYAMMRLSNGERYWIEPLVGRVAGIAVGSHIIYQSTDILEHGGVCGNPDVAGNLAKDVLVLDGGAPLAGGDSSDCITEIACEADFPYFESWGSISAVAGRVSLIIDTMNLQYESEVDITHVISGLVVRSTADSDPYTTNDAFDLICQLGNYWDTNLDVINRDVVQLFTGRDISGSIIGRAATFGGICDPKACGFFPCDGCGDIQGEASGHYSFVQSDFNGNFGCATDLSAHELGHLWNATHCSCPGCTMNPVFQCANTFCGAGVQATIIAFRDAVICLDCTGQDSFCGEDQAGNCYTSNTSPYCEHKNCCETVCATDPLCCNTQWDQLCAEAALDLCGNCGEAASGDCLSANGTPGCNDGECCAIVCMIDNFCCDSFWDELCADEAASLCGPPCPWDLNGDGTVNTTDLLLLFAQWGTNGPADFNNDGIVNIQDLLTLFANWGPCPASGLPPPLTLEQELADACISEEEWADYQDIMQNGTQAEKDNYQCWMLHWIEDCNRCSCSHPAICPGPDPFDD